MVNEDGGQSRAPWRERRKQQLRDELVSAAAALFAANGTDATSVDDIVGAAGVAKGTFYLHFKSKAEVADAVLSAALEELESRLREATEGAPEDARVRLKTVLRVQLTFLRENPGLRPLLFGGREAISPDIGPETRERVRALTTGLYERIIRTGMLQTHYREVDAGVAARVLQGTASALISDAAGAGEDPSSVESAVLEFFEKGVRRGL